MKKYFKYFLLVCSLFLFWAGISASKPKNRILVFTKTLGYRHHSIESGVAMFLKLGRENSFDVDTSSDVNIFTLNNLNRYTAIVFLSTTGEFFNQSQQNALKKYIASGGGFMGIHGASGAEYTWPWFGQLVGAYFDSHPEKLQKGTIYLKDKTNLLNKGLPESWEPVEEWYNLKSVSQDIHVLATVNENSYQGGNMGENHPIFWYQEFDGGRSFYTALGHQSETYREPVFVQHILNGLNYVMHKSNISNNEKVSDRPINQKDNIAKVLLAGDASVQEPMELSISKQGVIFYVERRGNVRIYNPLSKTTRIIGTIPVYSEHEDGLLGITLDPDFEKNHWLYVFYSAPSHEFNYHLSRFTFDTSKEHLDDESEKIMLKIHEEHSYSNHTGGSMCFDQQGNLFLSVGDNTIPFNIKGFAPLDDRDGRTEYDAQRSSGNTNDLRGKILRIHPQSDGSYTIPEGNLFPLSNPKEKPEIYVMGNRNPFRISFDKVNNMLYWGEVGPDAGRDSTLGPRGYDEVNGTSKPGNFGWPFFVADNKPYAKYDFATKAVGKLFDPQRPVNNAPRNTGDSVLPAAQKPLIWYPYAKSTEFPLLGSGGRCIMVGPVYHYDKTLKSDVKLPEYYDKCLFIYDFVRNWIMAVRLDEKGNYLSMEPFMGDTKFSAIVDMELGTDGALYILQYGLKWYQSNSDAGVFRLGYSKPNPIVNKSNSGSVMNTSIHGKDKASIKNKKDRSMDNGSGLIAKNDCKSCHDINSISVGPSFTAIAKKYKNQPAEISRLADKVISGGSGVWGSHAMSAHPQLPKKEASAIIKYIMTL